MQQYVCIIGKIDREYVCVFCIEKKSESVFLKKMINNS